MNLSPKAAPLAVLLALTAGGLYAQPGKVDPSIPGYTKAGGVSGNLNSVGSDTLSNLMTFWAEGFQKQYPNVKIQIEAKGSSTAPPALIAGTSRVGPMSREMSSSEVDAFEKKYGYKPTQVKVAIDALAVYVNKDNPLEQLTLQQVDGIFSKGRACGGKAITSWSDAGVKNAKFTGKPISLYGRNSASGTYGFFKEHALCKGDYKDAVKEQPGSAAVVQGVTEDLYGMGYSGIGYKTSGVKTLRLARTAGSGYFGTDPETVLSGKYPLSRFLYIYINQAPNKPLDPLVRELIKYVLSQEGQQAVVKDGFMPLPAKVAQEGRSALK